MTVKILIVEDDYLSRFLMQEVCGSLGYDCEVAVNGQQCLDRLKSGAADFDLILMDIHMPRISGLEATVTIRSDPTNPASALPIIAVTADVHWHNRDRCLAAGFDALLRKPVDLTELSATVETYAGRGRPPAEAKVLAAAS